MSTPEQPKAEQAAAKPRRWRRWRAVLVGAAAILGLVAVLLVGLRYGALTSPAQRIIEARAQGLGLGSFGRLSVQGFSGDIWRDFQVRRLTVADQQGVWLEARDVHVRWRSFELLLRCVHAERVEIGDLRILRRPIRKPSGPDTGMPVSIDIDAARGRVEMLPAFSYRRGVYDVDLMLQLQRRGGQRGAVRAVGVLSPGDHLNLQFDIGTRRPLLIEADAAEAGGGAIAGALGLAADRPFLLRVTADGRTSAGRFNALAISGADRPLEAAGAWTPTGGLASGRASLTASSLTADYARRFGPELRFNISGGKAPGGLYGLELQARTENLLISAQGLGDVGQRRLGPQGLRVVATSPAISRITGGPRMGAGRLTGVLTGGQPSWRFAGQAAVGQLALGAYALDEVGGPVQLALDAKGLTLKAQLSSRGGRGSGWIPAFFGAAPRADVEAARMADGRLSLRHLDLIGSGLKIQASGGRSLLGGLTFKGEAQVSNLAAAHAGARGGARIGWSAAQGRAREPWTLKLDGAADQFATGYPELDRLLGPRPKIAAQGAYGDGRLALQRVQLDGAAFDASSAGLIETNGKLSLKLDWRAAGPFRAGPVEITGRANGDGAVTGTLGAPRADLMANVQAVELPRLPLRNARLTLTFQRQADGSSGMITATADSGYGAARARSDFRFPEGGVDLTNLSLDAGGVKADGSLSLRRRAPSAADLTVAVTRGAFLDTGRLGGRVRILDGPGGPRVRLDLTAEQARPSGAAYTLTNARLTADGPLANAPYNLQLTGVSTAGKFALDGRGVFSQVSPGYAATFDGAGRLGARNVRTLETATVRFGGPERSAHLRLATADGGRVNLDGRLTTQAAEVRAQLAGVGLNMFNEDLAGRVDATLNLEGRGASLDGGLQAKLTGARGRGAPAASGVDGQIDGRLAGGALALDATATNGQGLRANANLVLPAIASGAPFRVGLSPRGAMRGRFFAAGEVRPLWDLLIGGDRSLSGQVEAQGTLGGTLADPLASGQISVSGGRFDDGASGLSLRNLTLHASFDRDAVDVTQASGVDGHGGSVDGAGRISLQRAGVSSFRLDLHGFRLIDNEQATASGSGQATITRDANGQVRISGALAVDRADVAARLPTGSNVVSMEVVERNRPATLETALPAPPSRGKGWALDVTLRAPGRVHLRGRGLNMELSLDAHVGGTTSNPELSGVARVIRGDYDFAGVRFTFDTTSAVYLATHARDIRLDLTAIRDSSNLIATARIRGTAAKPEITFYSTPSLPADEIISQVLFGQSASQLSPVEAAQLASAVSSLTSGRGLDVIGNLRGLARLDRLAFAGTQATGVTVSGGKYLTDNVYLELTGGGREGPSAQVEWRIKRDLSILSRVGGQAGARLAVRWRRDY